MALSTHKTSNYPTLIKYNGGKEPNFSGLNFQMASDTEAAGSCSAILNGEFYLFGGRTSGTKRQVKTTCTDLAYLFKYFRFQKCKDVNSSDEVN